MNKKQESKPKDKVGESQPYDDKLLNSYKQAMIVNDFKENHLSSDSYLSDNELYYLQKLSNNEALLEYFHYLQEGLVSLFIRAKISDGEYKVDGETSLVLGL